MRKEPFSAFKALNFHLEICPALQVKRYADICNNKFKRVVASYENIVRLQVSMQYLEGVQHKHTLNDLGKAISDLDLSKVLFVFSSLHNKLLKVAFAQLGDYEEEPVIFEDIIDLEDVFVFSSFDHNVNLVKPFMIFLVIEMARI